MNPRRPALLAALAAAVATAASPARAQDPTATQPADSTHARAEVYELSHVDVLPELRNRSEAADLLQRVYPRELRRRHETGTVVLRFVLLSDGAVDSASVVVENHSTEGFDEAAAAVVRRMRFRPARLHDQPVSVWVTLPVVFLLPSRQSPPSIPPASGTVPRPVPTTPPMP